LSKNKYFPFILSFLKGFHLTYINILHHLGLGMATGQVGGGFWSGGIGLGLGSVFLLRPQVRFSLVPI
jgi:hypothetical protein